MHFMDVRRAWIAMATLALCPASLPAQTPGLNANSPPPTRVQLSPTTTRISPPAADVSASARLNLNVPTQVTSQGSRTTTFHTNDGERSTNQTIGDATRYGSSRDVLGNTRRSSNTEIFAAPGTTTGARQNIPEAPRCTTLTFGNQTYIACEK